MCLFLGIKIVPTTRPLGVIHFGKELMNKVNPLNSLGAINDRK